MADAKSKLERINAIRENMTPAGKQMGCAQVAGTNLHRIIFREGGELPEELTGMYTTPYLAQADIEKYLARRWDDHEKKA